MKIYCYTNVSGYRIFDISRFKRTDEIGCPYITDEDIIRGKNNPNDTVYVLRSNNCGLNQKTIDLFFDSNISLLTKMDDGDNTKHYTLLYVDNVGNAISSAKGNDSKSFVFIAENEKEDAQLRKMGASLASGNHELSKKLHSVIFINVINDETVLYFDKEKWKDVLNNADTLPVSKGMTQVGDGLKYIIVCNGIPESALAKYIPLENISSYIVVGTRSIFDNVFFLGINKNKTIILIISALAAICIGYVMLKRN